MSERHHEAAAERVLAAASNLKPDRARQLPLDDPFYRPRVVAERLGFHYRTIIGCIQRGELKAERLGKRAIGIRASEVQRWLDAMKREAPPETRRPSAPPRRGPARPPET